jgi:hypothetical protein
LGITSHHVYFSSATRWLSSSSASPQSGTSGWLCPAAIQRPRSPASALRLPSREWTNVPDAGAGLPGAAAGFAVPTAYGDLTAVILALLALASLRYEADFAVPMLWLFNIVGLLDLIYANIATFKDHFDPVQLGVSYYLAVINVPAMVVVHILIFAYLLRSLPRTRSGLQNRWQAMNRTRTSLYYLAAYLLAAASDC